MSVICSCTMPSHRKPVAPTCQNTAISLADLRDASGRVLSSFVRARCNMPSRLRAQSSRLDEKEAGYSQQVLSPQTTQSRCRGLSKGASFSLTTT
jgi:hypothetical protein